MYFLKLLELIRSGCSSPGHSAATCESSVFPDNGELAPSLANTYAFVFDTPQDDLVLKRTSIAFLASGGRRMYASTFFLDLPAEMTMSILNDKVSKTLLNVIQVQSISSIDMIADSQV